MDLRKDPITNSWMLVGDQEDTPPAAEEPCPYCSGSAPKLIYALPDSSVRVYPHPKPIYRIEGDEGRSGEGIYDRMRTIGAHEVIVENSAHDRYFVNASDAEVEKVLQAYANRISDLKKDGRFRYVTVFKNRGRLAGEDIGHAHSEVTATPFVPRRLVYELRSAKQYFSIKERCVFCDVVRQEESAGVRVVESTGRFVAFCPFATRVPYEIWVLPRYHHASFEENMLSGGAAGELAALLRRCVTRLGQLSDAYHMVLHTTPNTAAKRGLVEKWLTLADDYHWHFEILPIAEKRTKSYSIKEVYYNPVSPERAAARLREL
jgi:UDPglucose--hexose-1-phosphate uridylyltransferase